MKYVVIFYLIISFVVLYFLFMEFNNNINCIKYIKEFGADEPGQLQQNIDTNYVTSSNLFTNSKDSVHELLRRTVVFDRNINNPLSSYSSIEHVKINMKSIGLLVVYVLIGICINLIYLLRRKRNCE